MMKIGDLLKEVGESKQPIQKKKLTEIMKNFKDVIERYERDGMIHKNDRDKIETLKDMVTHLVKEEDKRDGKL